MKVWIDQDLCTGDGICVEICPQVFTMADDGLAYVQEDKVVLSGVGVRASVPAAATAAVAEAAAECPGECIFIEH